MGREARTLPSRTVVVPDSKGNPVEVKIGQKVDYSIPHKDDDTGVIPEFVNISGKVQKVTIPYDEAETMNIKRFGILKGAQFRWLANPNRVWEKHPYFMERELVKGKYDDKYLFEFYD